MRRKKACGCSKKHRVFFVNGRRVETEPRLKPKPKKRPLEKKPLLEE
jgi:hypothetical protein